ncbi:MAG: DNA repair exonuclease [Blautia sp.]|nr:DNA repair exonuclease [Blautia sp.]
MRFVHLADVHLGAVPDRGCAWSARREEEIWETFRRVIAYIRENPVDLLFIAGDLFHRQPLKKELKEVNYLFTTIPETRVFLIAGNHDYLKRDSMYRTFSWAENVYFFGSEKVQSVHLTEPEVTVYGFSFCHREIREDLLAGCVPEDEEGLHILLAHGGDQDHVPMNVRSLSAAGFDYIALGHIHRPGMLIRNRAAFSGALEPIDRNDTGAHGFIEGYTDADGRLKIRFIPFAQRNYEEISVTLTENATQGWLEEEIRSRIEERGQQHIYRVLLDGVRPPDMVLIPERIRLLGNISEFADLSRFAYDLPLLEKQYSGTLIGDYIRYFRNSEMGEVEEKALMYGLQALLETSR